MSGERLTREKIIFAVLDASFEKGTGHTSLAQIAEHLHIKKASLYNHFSSRDDLLSETTRYCAEYMQQLSFTPPDIKSVAQKYTAETVFKGIINRFFKLHEHEPLIQIYSYIESEKYFSAEASTIVIQYRQRIISQTSEMMRALINAGKIPELTVRMLTFSSVWFCSAICNILSVYLVRRKESIRQNPESGVGELFALPSDESSISETSRLVEDFLQILSLSQQKK